jgi:outer membrane protein assembly factor BamB
MKKILHFFFIILIIGLISGCAGLGDLFSHTEYNYMIDEVSQAEGYQPDALWIYPNVDDMSKIEGEVNYDGVSYEVEGVQNIPLYGQEPSLVMDWMIGPDSEIIIVEALEYEFEAREGETGIHIYWLPNSTKFRIYTLNGDNGTLLWEIPLEGFKADSMEWFYLDSELMGIEFKEYGIDGSVTSTTYAAFRLDGSELVYQQTFPEEAQFFFVEQESDTLQILFTNEEQDIISRNWVVLDAVNGEILWQEKLLSEQTILHIQTGGLILNEGDQVIKLDSRTGSSSDLASLSNLNWIKILGDRLIMGNNNKFQLFDINQKRVLWEIAGDKSMSSFTLLDDKILLSNSDGTFTDPPEMERTPSLSRYYKNWDPHNDEVYDFYENFHTDLELLDLQTGESLWKINVEDRMNSNAILWNGNIALTTTKSLYLIDSADGALLNQEALPWGIWPVGVSIIDYNDSVLIETDLHVALWNQSESFVMVHDFHPLWESISSEAIYYDLRAGFWVLENMLEAPVEPNWLIASQDANNQWQKAMTQSINSIQQQLQATRDIQNISMMNQNMYMNMKYNSYSGTNTNPYSYSLDSAAATASQNMNMITNLAGWSRAVNLTAMGMMFANNQACYPLVKQQIRHLSDLDLYPWIIRLTSTGDENTVSQLELFNLDTGETREIVLGPRQAPDVVDKTMANGAVGLGIFGGYLNYTHLYPLNFRVLIDWKNQRLIHYGPGFETENHIVFGRKDNLRNFIYSRDISFLLE